MVMTLRFRDYLLMFTILSVFLGLACSPAAAERKVYTLEQLIQMALETSPELKMAEQDVISAKSDYNQAKAGQLPQLEITAIAGPVNDARVPTVNTNGHLVSHDDSEVGLFGRFDFAFVQPLYTFGKIANRKDAAALGVEAQRAGKEQKRNEIVLTVKELYFGYLVAAQGKSAAREADDFISDAGKRIKRLIELKAQNADPSDLYRLDAFSAEVKSFAAKADSGARLASAALKKAAGLPENAELNLDARELPKTTVELASEAEYVQLALAQRPELTQVKKGVAAKKKLADAAKSDFYPSLFAAAIGSVAGAPDRESFDNSYFTDDFNHSYAGIVAGAQWHFDFGITKGKLDKARAEHKKMQHTQEYAEKNIPLEVLKYYQEAVEARQTYTAYQQAVTGSRRWVVSAFSNFDIGVGTARDIFDAIDRYGKNQGEYLRSLYSYHVALARLNYAVGKGHEAQLAAAVETAGE